MINEQIDSERSLRAEIQPIASPCNGVCKLNTEAVCLGCGRTREEIGRWSSSNSQQKRTIVQNARQRRSAETMR
ncbi:DUF1289 domain-containing protein [Roseiconus sp. JC912]